MTYIWNRAEKANGAHNVTKHFDKWLRKQKSLLNLSDNQKDRNKLQSKIDRQTRNYKDALISLNNSNN